MLEGSAWHSELCSVELNANIEFSKNQNKDMLLHCHKTPHNRCDILEEQESCTCMSMATVIGPTPPGTGVINAA